MTRWAGIRSRFRPTRPIFRQLDEQDAHRPPLSAERQARLLVEMPERHLLIVVFAVHLLGERAQLVVGPGELLLGRYFDVTDDRSIDPFADPCQGSRELTRTPSSLDPLAPDSESVPFSNEGLFRSTYLTPRFTSVDLSQ